MSSEIWITWLNHADVQALAISDAEIAFTIGSTPEELGAFIKSETTKWTPVVKAAGMTPN